jgi:plastocyanin
MEYLEYTNELPEAFFGHYTMGSEIELTSQYDKNASMADARTINQDKGLLSPTLVEITEKGFMDPTITIDAGTAVKWTNMLDEEASVSEWDRIWGSGTLQPGESYVHYLFDAGTWHYYSNQQDRNTHEGAIIVE